MTGPEHYKVAETMLDNAMFIAYEDNSNDVGRREEYETEEAFYAALEHSNKAHRHAVAEAAMVAAAAQVHATLALAAATALGTTPQMTHEQVCGWVAAVTTAPVSEIGA